MNTFDENHATTTATETGVVSSDHLPSGQFAPGNKVGVATRYRPGQPSSNPGGVPKGTPKTSNWMPFLVDMTEDQLNDIVASKSASISKRASAQLLLDTLQGANASERLRALKEAMDRTEGKAIERTVNANMGMESKRSPQEIIDELQRLANYGQPG